jgi:UDP-N-acetylglucosamine 4,6-dehydratase
MSTESVSIDSSLAAFQTLVAGKRLLITGGTGSFGQTFVRTCLERSEAAEVIVYSRDEQKHVALQRRVSDPRLRCMLGDVRDASRLRLALRGVHFVFNAAAIKHVHFSEEHPMEAVATNVVGTHQVCQAALEAGVEALISLSTDKAVEPVNVMGMTKALHERVVGSFAGQGMRVGIVRYGNVLASNGSVVPYFRQLVAAGAKSLPVTDHRMTRFVLTLEDSVSLVLHAFAHAQDGETFVLDLPAFRIWDVAEVIARSAGRPVAVEEVGIRPGEKLHETLISAEEMRRTERRDGFWVVRRYRNAQERFAPAQAEAQLDSERAARLGPEEIRDLLTREDCLPAAGAAAPDSEDP